MNPTEVDEQNARLALTKVFSDISPPDGVEGKLFNEILQMLDPKSQVSIDCIGHKCLEFFKKEKWNVNRNCESNSGS